MCGLEGGWEVDNLEYWLAAKIYNINNNIKVEVIVIFKGELESAKGLLIHLAIITVLSEIFKSFLISIIASLV